MAARQGLPPLPPHRRAEMLHRQGPDSAPTASSPRHWRRRRAICPVASREPMQGIPRPASPGELRTARVRLHEPMVSSHYCESASEGMTAVIWSPLSSLAHPGHSSEHDGACSPHFALPHPRRQVTRTSLIPPAFGAMWPVCGAMTRMEAKAWIPVGYRRCESCLAAC
jgi:hypothetical protein